MWQPQNVVTARQVITQKNTLNFTNIYLTHMSLSYNAQKSFV